MSGWFVPRKDNPMKRIAVLLVLVVLSASFQPAHSQVQSPYAVVDCGEWKVKVYCPEGNECYSAGWTARSMVRFEYPNNPPGKYGWSVIDTSYYSFAPDGTVYWEIDIDPIVRGAVYGTVYWMNFLFREKFLIELDKFYYSCSFQYLPFVKVDN